MIQSSISIHGYDNDPTILTSFLCMKGEESRHMAINLTSVVRTYLEDTSFQEESRRIIAKREVSIPTFKKIVTQFVENITDLKTFRQQLDTALHTEHDWGARGVSFLMEINKLVKYHAVDSPIAEQGLRRILSGLNASNLGERIEQFYLFILQERERLQKAGTSSNKTISPGNSAAIISLFAFWLDRPGQPIIYYLSLRRGLKMLLEAGAIPKPAGLQIVADDRVEVRSNADHLAVLQALASLSNAAPMLTRTAETEAYWAERFLLWITDNPDVLEEETDGLGPIPPRRVFEDTPLLATPEPTLSKLIAEVRRHIFVDEAVIRHIYNALLAGHVVLIGPPGTGKTELACLIPEILWQSNESAAYTPMLVTATDEWSTRTLIGGITPNIYSGQVSYRIQHGYLTNAIAENWAINIDDPKSWQSSARTGISASGMLDQNKKQEYRGRWLVIDEFNRAPIDIALGEALTSLSGGDGTTLRIPVEGGSAELPLPKDFRIIGTLNSFDRNYLNQISEALKRRFAFVEVLPPSRAQRGAEQAIVLYKALKSIMHLSNDISLDRPGGLSWWHYSPDTRNHKQSYLAITPDESGTYGIQWTPLNNGNQIQETFDIAWDTFEVIRIYRLLGTAQMISLVRQMLITIIVQGYIDTEGCLESLDAALCDTIADQLQVLLPDELEVLIWFLKFDRDTFIKKYHEFLGGLPANSRRRRAHLEILSAVIDNQGKPSGCMNSL